MFHERELVIAEERRVYEEEAELMRLTYEKKEQALKDQIEKLNRHSETLTVMLAKRPLPDDESIALGNGDDESGSPAAMSAMAKKYEARLRNILKLREENEARMLAERKQLIEQMGQMEELRDKREKLREADAAARLGECDKMLAAWEVREEAMSASLAAANERLENLQKVAMEREALLMGEIEALRSMNAKSNDLAEGRERAGQQEIEALRAELGRLQAAYSARDEEARRHLEAHGVEMDALREVLRLARDRSKESKGAAAARRAEEERLALTEELGVLRRTTLERERELSECMEKALRSEAELRSALQEATDALEREQTEKREVSRRTTEELSRMQEHLRLTDQTHSRSEEIAANEIARLQSESKSLRERLKAERISFEKALKEQEDIVGKQLDAGRAEAELAAQASDQDPPRIHVLQAPRRTAARCPGCRDRQAGVGEDGAPGDAAGCCRCRRGTHTVSGAQDCRAQGSLRGCRERGPGAARPAHVQRRCRPR